MRWCQPFRKMVLNAGCSTLTVSETLTLSVRRVWGSEVSNDKINLVFLSLLKYLLLTSKLEICVVIQVDWQ